MSTTIRLRIPQDLLAGAFVILVAGFFLWWGWEYPMGRTGRMGAGWMPRAIGIALIALGAILLGRGVVMRRERVEIALPSPRVVLLVLGATALFALTDRLGLVLTVALASVAATLASREFRLIESVAFAVALAAFCALLFVTLLGQGVPVWPR